LFDRRVYGRENLYSVPAKILLQQYRHLTELGVSANVRFAPEAVVTNLNRRFDEQSEGW
jgi:hypothetical protein